MNITVKASNTEFTLYGVDFVPQQRDIIIKDEEVYTVEKRVWDDDNSETIIYATLSYASVPADVNDLEVIKLGKSGEKLQAVKLYKEIHQVGLREAKDWVDAHC